MGLASLSAVVLFVGAPIEEEGRSTPFPIGVEEEAPSPDDHNPHQQATPRWRLDPVPEVSIGMADGPEEYLLYRVLDATILTDGTIVAGMYSRELFELRYYDRDGTYITSAGRYGGGPFEVGPLGFLSLERLSGDSIMVVGRDPRYSVFGPRGESVREGRLTLTHGHIPSNLVDDGHLGLWFEPATVKNLRTPQPSVGEFSFFIYDLADGTTEAVGSKRYRRSPFHDTGLLLRLPFEPLVYWVAAGGRFWFGNSGEAEIRGVSPGGGEETAVISLGWSPRKVRREDERTWKRLDLRKARKETDRGHYAAHHRRLDFPENIPLFQDLSVDALGNVWVLRYELPWSEEDYSWEVFDPGGAKVAEASIPFEVLGDWLRAQRAIMFSPIKEIGEDYVLIRQIDELGVERVSRFRLVKDGTIGGDPRAPRKPHPANQG